MTVQSKTSIYEYVWELEWESDLGFCDWLGATSGIGAETALVLAKRGARLVLPARSLKAAEEAKARIVSECPESEIFVMSLDLSSLTSVRNFVSEFESLDLPLSLLM